ncbi:DUF2663 family protein [Bacillus sp. FJAT-45350]|uniref:DUF2663 family protein n=1 Tax=Bacillus sp. FJAT-45350 TaxID=2011014 RepID=UPI000BB84FBF|nr:DUF2663 family protein [Bacillus sp. FJAT-45350]
MGEFKEWKFPKESLSPVIKEVLTSLIKKKNKESKYEKLLNATSLTTLACILIGGVYLYLTKVNHTVYFTTILHSLVQDPFVFVYIGIIVVCLIQMRYAKKKFDKAEKEFESLRYEVIERCPELWDTKEMWEKRHHVFEVMEKEYDINLFHK